ncbi:MAG: nucleotidyl transferase AbiEii/AbiGii toxin family protein [Acidobacteriota bacterium]|nr:MAG: nucleotidyl transferase AbiEii/AbiGii toxin family protein [Acidobacteriota bacterium]
MSDNPRNLDPALFSCLRELVALFDDLSIRYTTVGGIALAMVSEPRFTRDIDTVIWIEREDWEPFIQQAVNHGFEPRNKEPLDFAQQHRIFLLTHRNTGITVDISLGALPFEEEMINRSVIAEKDELRLKVPTPEDLIIMKIIAGRPKDLVDIASILKIHTILDIKRVRYWARQFAEVLEMPEILENLEKLLGNSRAPRAE